MIKCMMVFGTMSFIVLLTIVRYDATSALIVSTWRSRSGSVFAMSSPFCKHVSRSLLIHTVYMKMKTDINVKHNIQQQPFHGPVSGTTRVSRYQKKHSPTHHPDQHPVFTSFFHLPRSIASSLFKLRGWQSFCTISFHVLFGLPLGLEPSTSYSIHFFTQSESSFHSTCPYHCSLFCCSINIISPIPSLSLNSSLRTLSFTLTLHIHLTILISAR